VAIIKYGLNQVSALPFKNKTAYYYARAPIYRYANLRAKDQALTAMLAIN
jgi:hypothetical protein